MRSQISFPDSSVGKEFTCNEGVPGSIPGLGRSAGEGKGYPLQHSWTSLEAQLTAMWETWVLFWSREFHGLYSPWDHKELDTTGQLSLSCSWLGFPGGTSGKEPACQCRRDETLVPSLGWEDSPGGGHSKSFQYLSGESHGQRSLAG